MARIQAEAKTHAAHLETDANAQLTKARQQTKLYIFLLNITFLSPVLARTRTTFYAYNDIWNVLGPRKRPDWRRVKWRSCGES